MTTHPTSRCAGLLYWYYAVRGAAHFLVLAKQGPNSRAMPVPVPVPFTVYLYYYHTHIRTYLQWLSFGLGPSVHLTITTLEGAEIIPGKHSDTRLI